MLKSILISFNDDVDEDVDEDVDQVNNHTSESLKNENVDKIDNEKINKE